MTDKHVPRRARRLFTRRTFLRGSGAALAAATFVTAGIACEDSEPSTDSSPPAPGIYHGTAEAFYDQNSPPPPASPDGSAYHFFTSDEAKAATALFATILPGTDSDPGATEGGVVIFVDYKLAANDGFDEPTYRSAPFAEVYEGQPPADLGSPDAKVVYIEKSEADRYGFQSILAPRETYRGGLGSLDRYSRAKHGAPFAELDAAAQREIVGDLADGKTGAAPDGSKYFSSPTDTAFFKEVQKDVVKGMFADPAYGGNRGLVGWKLVRYPGAQRGYTPGDMLSESVREPQSMAQLMASHSGEATGPNVILPVSSGVPGQYDGHRAP